MNYCQWIHHNGYTRRIVMKADIYYFTGTGNSLTVAKDSANEIEGKLISIAYVMGKETIKTKVR